MLRSPYLRKTTSQSFICWKCSAKLHSGYARTQSLGARPGQLSTFPDRLYLKRGTRSFSTTKLQKHAEVLSTDPSSLPPESLPPAGIRKRLREWDLEHASSHAQTPDLADILEQGDVLNNLIRTNDGDFRMELDEEETENDIPLILYTDLIDVGTRRGFLLPGDLVELRAVVGQAEELAIFVRELENQSQFYTMSGKWIHRSSQSAHFFVPHFVDPKELEEIRPYLPTTDIQSALRDKLQDFPLSVPREVGKPLILKMLDFWAASDSTYQAYSVCLDNAHERIAHLSGYTYATLEQIAEKVLTEDMLMGEVRPLPAHVLYAVHRSLFRDDIGFRPQTKGTLRTGGQYEISSLNEYRNIKLVREFVRKHREKEAAKIYDHGVSSLSQLEQFAIDARRVLDLSRKTQPFTVYGTIMQSTWQKSDHGLEVWNWFQGSNHNKVFILFLESWAALSSFGNSSSLNGIGSEILRAIQRYGDVNLDATTAWTFLQEIGATAPWENRLSFDLKLPGVGQRLGRLLPISAMHPPILEDRLKDNRKDWGDLPIYCIDDPGAHEIDDGISIEGTNVNDEYWIHVHAADPASHFDVSTVTAETAEFTIENVYMPDRVHSMLPKELVQKHFSLAPDRPSMTFSARMHKSGHILETKITPGVIHEVIFFSPAVLDAIVVGLPSSGAQAIVRVVGQDGPDVAESFPNRTMFESHDLSDSHKTELQLLHEIGDAHATLLRAKGGVDQNFPSKPKLSVKVPGNTGGGQDGTPRIELSTVEAATESNSQANRSNLVQSCMLIAAQVAARWCSDRGIPIPYRVTPRNPAKEDPSGFFIRKVLPSRAETGVAPIEITSQYLRLIGGAVPSLAPGPHAAVGVDMMARCTSPLRRFTDLLVHWQIGATLLEEARLGKSLIGNTRDDFLPFSKARVEALLPRLDNREKLIKYGQKEADRQWLCMFLLRAWQFKEAELPSTLPFLVKSVDIDTRKIFGMLTDFSTRAQCFVSDEMNLEEIRVGETLRVELEHINVYERKILVKTV